MTAIPVNSSKQDYTKTLILALLVARKGGCLLKHLDADYFEQEGESIPWRAFGFVSLFDFLKSMPETVRLSNKNGLIHVTGIPSDKSKHVSKLVSEQKCDPKHNTRAWKTFRPSHYYPHVAPPKIYVPADLLTMIIDLVHANPDGVSKDYLLCLVQSQMPCVSITLKDIEDHLYQLSHVLTVRYNKVFPIKKMRGHTNNNNLSTNSDNIIKQQVPNPMPEVQTIKYCAGGSEDSDGYADFETEHDFHFIPQSTEGNRNEVVKETISNFEQESAAKYKSEEKYYETIYKTVGHNKNGCWQFMDNGNNLTHIFDNTLQNNENCENADILINNRTKVRLASLIQKYPDGIWCAELPEKYLDEYKISLNYMDLGFNSVREFASHLPDIFHCVQPNETSDFILYYAKNDAPTDIKHAKPKNTNSPDLRKNYDSGDEADPLPATVSVNTCRGLIPDNVMTIGECVGQLNVDTLLNPDKPYIEVFVIEVFTPSFFWIQLRKKLKTFRKFMNEFHQFYMENNKDYAVPSVVLEKGLNCACKYNDIWHRGIIKSVKPDLRVTVMFYDYGTLKTYPPEEIHYLDKRYSDLPAQAIACGLVNTKPINSRKWTRGVTHEFASRTAEIPLVATIASVNSEDNSMLVTLTDTLEDEDIHINDWLVERKLAVYGKMVCMKFRNFLFRYYLECRERYRRSFRAVKNINTEKLITLNNAVTAHDVPNNEIALYDSKTNLGGTPFISEKNILKDSTNQMNEDRVRCSKTISSVEKDSYKNETSLYQKLLKLKKLARSVENGKLNSVKSVNRKHNTKANEHFLLDSAANNENDKVVEKETLFNTDKQLNTRSTAIRDKKLSSITFNAESESETSPTPIFRYPDVPAENEYSVDQDYDDVACFRMCSDNCNRQHKIQPFDWSLIREGVKPSMKTEKIYKTSNLSKVKYKSLRENRNAAPEPDSIFLNAVRSSAYFSSSQMQIPWSTAGNIVPSPDLTYLVMRQLKECRLHNLRGQTATVLTNRNDNSSENFSDKIEQQSENEAGSKLEAERFEKSFQQTCSTEISELNLAEENLGGTPRLLKTVDVTPDAVEVVASNIESDVSSKITEDKVFAGKRVENHGISSFIDNDSPKNEYNNELLLVKASTPKSSIFEMLQMDRNKFDNNTDLDSDDSSSLEDFSVSTVFSKSYEADVEQSRIEIDSNSSFDISRELKKKQKIMREYSISGDADDESSSLYTDTEEMDSNSDVLSNNTTDKEKEVTDEAIDAPIFNDIDLESDEVQFEIEIAHKHVTNTAIPNSANNLKEEGNVTSIIEGVHELNSADEKIIDTLKYQENPIGEAAENSGNDIENEVNHDKILELEVPKTVSREEFASIDRAAERKLDEVVDLTRVRRHKAAFDDIESDSDEDKFQEELNSYEFLKGTVMSTVADQLMEEYIDGPGIEKGCAPIANVHTNIVINSDQENSTIDSGDLSGENERNDGIISVENQSSVCVLEGNMHPSVHEPPVFNDIEIESGEEEFDVQVDAEQFLRNVAISNFSSFFGDEEDSGPKITELHDEKSHGDLENAGDGDNNDVTACQLKKIDGTHNDDSKRADAVEVSVNSNIDVTNNSSDQESNGLADECNNDPKIIGVCDAIMNDYIETIDKRGNVDNEMYKGNTFREKFNFATEVENTSYLDSATGREILENPDDQKDNVKHAAQQNISIDNKSGDLNDNDEKEINDSNTFDVKMHNREDSAFANVNSVPFQSQGKARSLATMLNMLKRAENAA